MKSDGCSKEDGTLTEQREMASAFNEGRGPVE